MNPPRDVTRLLLRWRDGDRDSLDELLPLVYDELRKLAASYLRRERAGHTLQATALVGEVYLKMVDQKRVDWQGRAHFMGFAAKLMRQILVDYHRGHAAAKRGDGAQKLSLDEAVGVGQTPPVDIGELDEALGRLARLDALKGRVVEMRFFGGLTVEETAEALGVQPNDVRREWRLAKAWLACELEK